MTSTLVCHVSLREQHSGKRAIGQQAPAAAASLSCLVD